MRMKEIDNTMENVTYVGKQGTLIEKIRDMARVAFNVKNVVVKEFSMNTPIIRLWIGTENTKAAVYEIEISELELLQRYKEVTSKKVLQTAN